MRVSFIVVVACAAMCAVDAAADDPGKPLSTDATDFRPALSPHGGEAVDDALLEAIELLVSQDIADCYTAEVTPKGSVQLTLTLELALADDAIPVASVTPSDDAGAGVAACVEKQAADWKLTGHTGKKIVHIDATVPAIGVLGELSASDGATVEGLGTIGTAGGVKGTGGGGESPAKTEGQPSVTGSLDKAVIRKVVAQHKKSIKACYEKKLAKDPEASGKVMMEFVVDSDGSVSSAKVTENTFDDDLVANCVTKSVKQWRFPKPDGGGLVLVKYPFLFEAQ